MKSLIALFTIAVMLVSCSSDDSNNSTSSGQNEPPQIVNVTASPNIVHTSSYGGSTQLNCIATDTEDDSLRYNWSCDFGNFDSSVTVQAPRWRASGAIGIDTVYAKVAVSDGRSIDVDSVALRITR